MQQSSKDRALRGATLETLLRFLGWIPLDSILQTQLAPQLIHFLEDPFLGVTLKCLTEIPGSSPDPRYDEFWVALFSETMRKLEQQLLPQKTNIMELSLFLCIMLKQHGPLLEQRDHINFTKALDYMVLISEVEDTEIFKIFLEYWNVLVADLYRLVTRLAALLETLEEPGPLQSGSSLLRTS